MFYKKLLFNFMGESLWVFYNFLITSPDGSLFTATSLDKLPIINLSNNASISKFSSFLAEIYPIHLRILSFFCNCPKRNFSVKVSPKLLNVPKTCTSPFNSRDNWILRCVMTFGLPCGKYDTSCVQRRLEQLPSPLLPRLFDIRMSNTSNESNFIKFQFWRKIYKK